MRGARRVSDEAVARTKRHPVVPAWGSDAGAGRACLDLEREHRWTVEPACGAARVLLMVCGGVA